MQHFRVIVIAAAIGCFATPAFAYLDPGTGSMIIQVIIGAIAAALLSIKLAWQRIKFGIASMFHRQSSSQSNTERQN